jgi:hypothetical protein
MKFWRSVINSFNFAFWHGILWSITLLGLYCAVRPYICRLEQFWARIMPCPRVGQPIDPMDHKWVVYGPIISRLYVDLAADAQLAELAQLLAHDYTSSSW